MVKLRLILINCPVGERIYTTFDSFFCRYVTHQYFLYKLIGYRSRIGERNVRVTSRSFNRFLRMVS